MARAVFPGLGELKTALGLSDMATTLQAHGDLAGMILKEGVNISLTGGFWLRRARVMDSWRIEVVNGASQRSALQALGGFVEIINYQPRVFVPPDGDVLQQVLKRWPVQSVSALAA